MARYQRRITKVFFLSVALMAEITCAKASELWDYIRVGRNSVAEPKWAARSGKAQVEIRGDHIQIHIDYTDAADGLSRAAVTIVGTIQADHTVKANCTFLNTDAAPIQLNGRYFIRNDVIIAGEKQKVVTDKEIVFSRSGSIAFLGFLSRDVRDK
jgi:hypothetical protein